MGNQRLADHRVLRPPHDEDWGARTFDLPDLSGNTIFVMGPVVASRE